MTAGIIISLKKHEKPCQELFEFFTKNHFSLIPSSRTDPKGRIVVNGYKIYYSTSDEGQLQLVENA
jgi:hypothetical protein